MLLKRKSTAFTKDVDVITWKYATPGSTAEKISYIYELHLYQAADIQKNSHAWSFYSMKTLAQSTLDYLIVSPH